MIFHTPLPSTSSSQLCQTQLLQQRSKTHKRLKRMLFSKTVLYCLIKKRCFTFLLDNTRQYCLVVSTVYSCTVSLKSFLFNLLRVFILFFRMLAVSCFSIFSFCLTVTALTLLVFFIHSKLLRPIA